jgi:hypothetical protein
MHFIQYDVVRVMALHVGATEASDAFNLRGPAIGDVATIIEIYSKPPGFELECNDENGITQWPIAYGPDDLELELIA